MMVSYAADVGLTLAKSGVLTSVNNVVHWFRPPTVDTYAACKIAQCSCSFARQAVGIFPLPAKAAAVPALLLCFNFAVCQPQYCCQLGHCSGCGA